MKWFIASDIHGSKYYCDKMISAYRREKADKMLLLGDILYHGPRNDLPKDYEPKAVIEMLNSMKDDILCVRGNCDTEVDQMVLEFPILADYCILSEGNKMIFATHGHDYNEANLPPLHKGDVVVRIFPTEKDDDSKEILGMGMFVTKDSPNDIKVNIPNLFECIPDIEN